MKKNLSGKQKAVLSGLSVMCLLIAGIGVWMAIKQGGQESDKGGAGVVLADTEDWEMDLEKEDPGGVKEGILIPGYGTVNMEADKTVLPISLGNPKENKCYFKVKITLSDTTVLHETDYIEPGQGMTGVPLAQKIVPGTYKVLLTYRCFSMDGEMTELNGAESEFTLIVN